MENQPASRPVRLPTADLLRLADAFPLLDRLVLLVTIREGGHRDTIVFGILDGLQDHLDAMGSAGPPMDGAETVDAIRDWFHARIADEEAQARGPGR